MKSGANLELEHGKPRRVTSLWSLKVVTETGRNLHDHPQANSAEKTAITWFSTSSTFHS
jgi:hypothetical protein